MDIRPQDLPELRNDLLQALYRHSTEPIWEEALKTDQTVWTQAADLPTPAMLAQLERGRIADAELFYASAEMTELAVAASESLPIFQMNAEDPPAPVGLMVFGRAIEEVEWGGVPTSIVAASWQIAGGRERGGIVISFLADRSAALQGAADRGATQRDLDYMRSEMPAITPMIGSDSIWNFAARDRGAPVNDTSAGIDRAGRTLRSAWLLMQQTLADVQEVEADRAARKRLRRIGQEPAPVRVIELRRPKHASSEPGESVRNYTHRWITRGHWRQQWYATRQVHRPVWIAPHVKGPEGAPMIGGEKVYAWKR